MTILRRHVKNFAFKHPAKSGMMSLCITQDKGENNTIWEKKSRELLAPHVEEELMDYIFAYAGENR